MEYATITMPYPAVPLAVFAIASVGVFVGYAVRKAGFCHRKAIRVVEEIFMIPVNLAWNPVAAWMDRTAAEESAKYAADDQWFMNVAREMREDRRGTPQ